MKTVSLWFWFWFWFWWYDDMMIWWMMIWY